MTQRYTQVSPRGCEGCNVCCIQPEIHSLHKPAGITCTHCELGVGCRCWDTRPSECSRFFCLWVTSHILPPALRPDRCGVMFEPLRGKQVLMALCDRLEAWKSPIPMQIIQVALNQGISVIVIDGKDRHMLLPEGGTITKTKVEIAEAAKSMGLI